MTGRPPLTVADVIRQFAPALVATGRVTSAQERVLRDLAACRTAQLGGHVLRCGHCRERVVAYNSCRNRHCPSCLNHKSREWLEAREADLLPVEYFHVVFTVPEEIAGLALGNKKVVYDILFAAVAETLQTIGADPQHLGAQLGFLAVLHTWDQKLRHHPHVHCIVPSGGLSADGTRWVSCRPGFFLPVRVLSRLFRGKFLAKLREAYEADKLRFAGSTAPFESEQGFRVFTASCRRHEWVVYAKPPFGSPLQVLKYLARYTHRVAISNARVIAIDGDHVVFRYRSDSKTNRYSTMRITGVEFLRRFVQHVLPKGYTRIRHFGFLANRYKRERLELCRSLLEPNRDEPGPDDTSSVNEQVDDGFEKRPCPSCGRQRLRVIRELRPTPQRSWRPLRVASWREAVIGSP